MTYTAAYHFMCTQDRGCGVTQAGPLSNISTVESIEAGRSWLAGQLMGRVFLASSDGFAEVIDTVDDRTVLHYAGTLQEVRTELTRCACRG